MDTLFIGQNHIHLDEVDSTNSYAISLLKNVNLTEGTLISAKHQTKGRGQRGNLWDAMAGQNATFSLIVKPAFLNENQLFYLSKCAALALYDVLAYFLNTGHFDIKIKWPNDILVNGKKIAGVLIENVLSGRQLSWSVAGIGLNINQTSFSDGLNATSIKSCTGQDHDIMLAIRYFCTAFEGYYLQLKNKSFNSINENYALFLFGLKSWINVEVEGMPLSLFFEAVTEDGRINLSDRGGNTYLFDVKQIKWLKLTS